MQKYEEIFAKYDDDSSGTIDIAELGKILAERGHEVSDDDLKVIMAEIDDDDSGTLDFSEFMAAIEGSLSKRSFATRRSLRGR